MLYLKKKAILKKIIDSQIDLKNIFDNYIDKNARGFLKLNN